MNTNKSVDIQEMNTNTISFTTTTLTNKKFASLTYIFPQNPSPAPMATPISNAR